jgi:hypothetical protein
MNLGLDSNYSAKTLFEPIFFMKANGHELMLALLPDLAHDNAHKVP